MNIDPCQSVRYICSFDAVVCDAAGMYSISILLGTPVQSNAIKYNCSAIKSTFMTLCSVFVDTVTKVLMQLCVLACPSSLLYVGK